MSLRAFSSFQNDQAITYNFEQSRVIFNERIKRKSTFYLHTIIELFKLGSTNIFDDWAFFDKDIKFGSMYQFNKPKIYHYLRFNTFE